MDPDFELKIKNSFTKVREDIELIKKDIKKLKEAVILQNKVNSALKVDLEYLKSLLNEIRSSISDISTRNRGVDDNKQQSMTINDNAKHLKFLLENKFKSLTDREFSVFMAIYQLEEEIGEVGYQDIANKLNIVGSNVRNYVSSLINRGVPVGKERLFNRKTKFYIKKEFRDLNIIADLIEMRQNKNI